MPKSKASKSKIKQSSTAEYFAKNLQQVGFSSPVKAVLTTLKESVDNSLDACEESGILPEINVTVDKVGSGAAKNTDLVKIIVEDNGPGLEVEDLPKVFGEYLASSKFGKGQCSRGQQGIGISAATTWAQLTNAMGVVVTSKTPRMRKAVQVTVDVDIKSNKGKVKNKKIIDWNKKSGLKVEFRIDGRVHLNGDGGLITYLEGTTLVNPHISLSYILLDKERVRVERVSDTVPQIPAPVSPHPHTLKLGEFLTHAHLYDTFTLSQFLKKGFSRISDNTLKDFVKHGLSKSFLARRVSTFSENEFKTIFKVIQKSPLANPSTRSVLVVGEEGLARSIQRLGKIDFFSVVTRKPRICDFKPVVVEVAAARFLDKAGAEDTPVQLLRFANRVPLQFDKGGCAITKAVESVNWKAYGLNQPKKSLPQGPYVFAVSVTSPFIKFKNASKETIDSSDDLVEEIRLALMKAGQKLSRHIKREHKAEDLERKIQHIEKFGPIFVEGLVKITSSKPPRKERALKGLRKILGRDTKLAKEDLVTAESRLATLKEKQRAKLGDMAEAIEEREASLVETSKEETPSAKKLKARAKKSKGQKTKVKKSRTQKRKKKAKSAQISFSGLGSAKKSKKKKRKTSKRR